MNDQRNQAEEQNETQETEQLNFTKPDFVFEPQGNHDWRQKGPYIVCKSCELEHAVWIGTERLLVGIDADGKAILRTRKELGMA